MLRSRRAKDSSKGMHLSAVSAADMIFQLHASCRRNSNVLPTVSREAEERRRKAELRAKRADDENKRKVSTGAFLG